MVIFHSYVSLPEGKLPFNMVPGTSLIEKTSRSMAVGCSTFEGPSRPPGIETTFIFKTLTEKPSHDDPRKKKYIYIHESE